MAHKTRIDGTAYTVKGGRTLVDGTGYSIKGGRTLVDGTGYDISFGVSYDPVFSNNDWATIIAVCQAGLCPDEWAVGDQKSMTINSTDYLIDIIGKNHDTYSDGSGMAPLTFQMHDCYATAYGMNSSPTNAGGWTDCAMRSTHLPAILALMPSEVQDGIREVNKLTSAGARSSTINTTADKLFLLSEVEVFGSYTNSKIGEGSKYAYYSAGNSTAKNMSGSAERWWERSPEGTGASGFCCVGTSGSIGTSAATYGRGVAFAFCF